MPAETQRFINQEDFFLLKEKKVWGVSGTLRENNKKTKTKKQNKKEVMNARFTHDRHCSSILTSSKIAS